MPSPRFPIPQGTLDMLILQILSVEPAHGYGIAQPLEQISRSVVQVTGYRRRESSDQWN
jgi:DNA-binding PadR family transcriptional regulator